jgi:DNA-binding winged helix-turn-helix (wHTH) protein
VVFPPFRLDTVNETLWRDSREIALRPKTFAVLRYLLEHADRLVTREELLNALWPNTVVSEEVLTGRIRELRKVLEDNRKTPRFIQTVQGRGYRFIAPLSTTQPVASSQYPVVSRKASGVRDQQMQASGQQLATENWQLATCFVGREAELAQLHGWFEKALRGERQIVFVTGEPGISKTTVVEAFLAQLGARGWGLGASPLSSPQPQFLAPNAQHPTPSLRVARGQCIEHHGPGEAYLPVLEALSRLCREPGGEGVVIY